MAGSSGAPSTPTQRGAGRARSRATIAARRAPAMKAPTVRRSARASGMDTRAGQRRLAGGRPLFFFDGALAVDAVAGEREGFQPLLGDALAATFAGAEIAVVELLQ